MQAMPAQGRMPRTTGKVTASDLRAPSDERELGHCGLEPQTPVLSGPCSSQLS